MSLLFKSTLLSTVEKKNSKTSLLIYIQIERYQSIHAEPRNNKQHLNIRCRLVSIHACHPLRVVTLQHSLSHSPQCLLYNRKYTYTRGLNELCARERRIYEDFTCGLSQTTTTSSSQRCATGKYTRLFLSESNTQTVYTATGDTLAFGRLG